MTTNRRRSYILKVLPVLNSTSYTVYVYMPSTSIEARYICNFTVIAIENVSILWCTAMFKPHISTKGLQRSKNETKTISRQRLTHKKRNFCPFSWCEDDFIESGAPLYSLPGATKGCETSHGGFGYKLMFPIVYTLNCGLLPSRLEIRRKYRVLFGRYPRCAEIYLHIKYSMLLPRISWLYRT